MLCYLLFLQCILQVLGDFYQNEKLFPEAIKQYKQVLAIDSWNLSAKYKIESDDFNDTDDVEDIKKTDFGIVFGFGTEFGNICIDGRYEMGLTSIDDSDDNLDVKNRVFSFMLGYMF